MTAGTFSLRRAAVVYVALLCAVKVYALEDPTTIKIPESGSISTTVNKFNCIPPKPANRVVRFQSINVGSSQYERVSMSDQELHFYFRESAKSETFIAASYGLCLFAAGKAGMDAMQFVNNICTGYNLRASDVLCGCSSGTNVVFVKNSKIQSTVPIGGFKKTVGNQTFTLVYPSILSSAIYSNDDSITGDCYSNTAQMASNMQYHDSAGSCPGSYAIIDTSQCTSSCSMTPMVVISPLNPSPNKYFLDSCGFYVIIPLSPDTTTPFLVQSHVGYGCSLYTQPDADTECLVTFVGVNENVHKINIDLFLALSTNGGACQDDLTIHDSESSGPLITAATCTAGHRSLKTTADPPRAYVTFKRRAAVSGTSPPIGFYMAVSGTAA